MTTHYFLCTRCHQKYRTHQNLFHTLYDFERSATAGCPSCDGERDLYVGLDFQLGAGDGEFKVVSAFLPEKLESWLGEGEEEVTFYPFLAGLERSNGSRFSWLPYWHVTGKEARYGQHAICLDQGQFESLIQQLKRAPEMELTPV